MTGNKKDDGFNELIEACNLWGVLLDGQKEEPGKVYEKKKGTREKPFSPHDIRASHKN